MMTHANAAKADRTERPNGMAGIIALAAGILVSLGTIGAIAASPAAIPAWCATHACPTIPTFQHIT